MNSLCSDSISYFVAQIAYRNQRLNNDSKDLHSSKDLLVRNVFENSFEENMEHEVRLRACSLGSSKMTTLRINSSKTFRTKCGNRRQAFSVVGVKNMACPAIPKRRRKSTVSATFCLIPLPKIGEGFGEWFEVLLRTRRIRWL